MLYLEESVETILAEEGQDLLGLSFLTETLGLTMKKMEVLFKKSALQYSRRRPIEETRTFNANYDSNVATLMLPEGIRAVKAVRYGILEQLPRYYMDDFGKMSFEYEEHTRLLKVWPPITPLRVTYTRDLEVTKTRKIVGSSTINSGETYFYTELPTTPIGHSLKISFQLPDEKGEIVEEDKYKYTIEYQGTDTETNTGVFGDEEQDIITLGGNLGNGTYNVATRELELNFNDIPELADGGVLVYEYYPMYYMLPDIGLHDEIFNKLFASKILEALASLRAQSTQEVLHNIDLTTDELYTRVRVLKRELNTLLRNTIKFSGMAPI